MCLDFVARVESRGADAAVVTVDGRRRRASTLLVPDVAAGDWVRVALGTIIERLDANEAALVNESIQATRGALP